VCVCVGGGVRYYWLWRKTRETDDLGEMSISVTYVIKQFYHSCNNFKKGFIIFVYKVACLINLALSVTLSFIRHLNNAGFLYICNFSFWFLCIKL
jgi:hypothetical protein